MTREQIARRLGPHLTIAGREHLHTFQRGGALFLPYSAVKNWRLFEEVLAELSLGMLDGQHGVEIVVER